jgi:hypothetical protein
VQPIVTGVVIVHLFAYDHRIGVTHAGAEIVTTRAASRLDTFVDEHPRYDHDEETNKKDANQPFKIIIDPLTYRT